MTAADLRYMPRKMLTRFDNFLARRDLARSLIVSHGHQIGTEKRSASHAVCVFCAHCGKDLWVSPTGSVCGDALNAPCTAAK
jgi:hypothetical protein